MIFVNSAPDYEYAGDTVCTAKPTRPVRASEPIQQKFLFFTRCSTPIYIFKRVLKY